MEANFIEVSYKKRSFNQNHKHIMMLGLVLVGQPAHVATDLAAKHYGDSGLFRCPVLGLWLGPIQRPRSDDRLRFFLGASRGWNDISEADTDAADGLREREYGVCENGLLWNVGVEGDKPMGVSGRAGWGRQ